MTAAEEHPGSGTAVVVDPYNAANDIYKLIEYRLDDQRVKKQEENERMKSLQQWYAPPKNYFAPDQAVLSDAMNQIVELGTSYMEKGTDWRDPRNKEAYLAMTNLISRADSMALQSVTDRQRYEKIISSFDPSKHDIVHFDERMKKYTSLPLGERSNIPMDFLREQSDPFSVFDMMKSMLPGAKISNEAEAKAMFGLIASTPEGQDWYSNEANKENGKWKDLQGAEKFFIEGMKLTFPDQKVVKPKPPKAPAEVIPPWQKQFNMDPTVNTKDQTLVQDGSVNEIYITDSGTNKNLGAITVNVDGTDMPFSVVKLRKTPKGWFVYGEAETPDTKNEYGATIKGSKKFVNINYEENRSAFKSQLAGFDVNEHIDELIAAKEKSTQAKGTKTTAPKEKKSYNSLFTPKQ